MALLSPFSDCVDYQEKYHFGTFRKKMFPFASFYAISKIGTKVYEKYHHGLSLSSFTSFCRRCRPSILKDHIGVFKPRLFPSAYFYAFSGRGAALYEKSHPGLSLRSFGAFSSRKYCRANLVSFMLLKVFE